MRTFGRRASLRVGLLVVMASAGSGWSADVGVSDAGLTSIALPGTAPVGMDYLAFDSATGKLWVPAGNTGRLDVIDSKTGTLQAIEGLPTAARGERTVGVSSATVGDGVVYVGNRADSTLCGFDATRLSKRGCVTLSGRPDGVAWVGSTREVWVTVPSERALVMVKEAADGGLVVAGDLKVPGSPEGYAVDPVGGRFFTNLEDADRTLVIDAKARTISATYAPGCGKEGPRGLAFDRARGQLFVACTDGVKVLAVADGGVLGSVSTGAGVDNIDLQPGSHRVFVASGADGQLTVAEADAAGHLKVVSRTATAKGARTVVIDPQVGRAYLPDSRGGRIIVVPPLAPAR